MTVKMLAEYYHKSPPSMIVWWPVLVKTASDQQKTFYTKFLFKNKLKSKLNKTPQ